MRTKLTISELNNFKSVIPVAFEELKDYVGGGNGNGISTAYSFSEYRDMGWSFTSGWVRFSSDDVRYLTQNFYEYCGNSSSGGYVNSTYNCSCNGYSNSSYSGGSYFTGSSEYFGSFDTYSYDESCMIISDLIAELPQTVRGVFQYIDAGYDDCIPSTGRYYPEEKSIRLKELNYNTLFRECVHATQDIYHLGGDNHAALEYQEHILGDLEQYRQQIIKSQANMSSGQGPRVEVGPLGGDYKTTDSDEFAEWIESCMNKDTQEVNMTNFLSGVNNYVSQFQSSHADKSGYQGDIPEDYNYEWREMIQAMGFKISE